MGISFPCAIKNVSYVWCILQIFGGFKWITNLFLLQQSVQLSVSLQTITEQKKQLEDDLQHNMNEVRPLLITMSYLAVIKQPFCRFLTWWFLRILPKSFCDHYLLDLYCWIFLFCHFFILLLFKPDFMFICVTKGFNNTRASEVSPRRAVWTEADQLWSAKTESGEGMLFRSAG